MAVLRLSFANLAEGSAAIAQATGQACGYCSTEAQQPQRPFRPWRSLTTTTTQELIVDLGSSQTLHVVGLVNAGFTSALIQAGSSSGFSLAANMTYCEAVVLTRNPLQWRYQHTHLTTGFGYRYLRLKLDATTATCAGTVTLGSTSWSLGGLWAGQLTSAPGHLLQGARFRTIQPVVDVGPSHRGWVQRLQAGNPRAQIEGTLSAQADPATPAFGDDLDTWSDLIRQAWSADYVYVYLALGDVSQGYVARWRDDPDWTVEGRRAQTGVVLDEVVGP